MAWIKCRKCGRRISDKEIKCSKCGNKLKKLKVKKDYKDIILELLFLIIQVILTFTIFKISKEILYSDEVLELYIILALDLLLVLNGIFAFRKIIILGKRRIIEISVLLVCVLSLAIGVIYGFKIIKAFRYENSRELYNLTEKYTLDDAKKIKTTIDKIFEYDDGGISSRNIIIGNFYEDEDYNVLYIDDFYGNYRLKFYLEMKDNEILNVFWMFDDNTKLYLVNDGQRTEDFSYYYAMYIVDSVMGEDISGLATIEEDVLKFVKNEFEESANTMLTYDELIFDSKENKFIYKCSAVNMDYYADIEHKDFEIEFNRLKEIKNKKVWYYGDSSFDYVNWNINI